MPIDPMDTQAFSPRDLADERRVARHRALDEAIADIAQVHDESLDADGRLERAVSYRRGLRVAMRILSTLRDRDQEPSP